MGQGIGMFGYVRRVATMLALCAAGWAQQADIATIRLLAERLHQAYEAKDASTIDGLWSEQSPEKKTHREATERLFANPATGAIHESTVRDPEVADGRARLRVDREAGSGRSKLTLEWVKDASDWKIAKESPAEQELAGRVAASEHPDALLAANEDLIDADLAQALIDRGATARSRGDTGRAIAILELARSLSERAGSSLTRERSFDSLGNVYFDQGDFPRALDCYRTSLDLSRQIHDDAGTSRILTNLSSMYSSIGDFGPASEALDESLALARKLHDTRLTTNALGNLGVLYARRGDYRRAMTYLHQAQDLIKDGANQRALAANYNNIGNVYLWQGDFDQSQEQFERQLEVAQAAGLKPLIAVAWMGLGQVAEFRGDARTAIGNYEKSLAVFNETGNKPFAASDLTYIGSAYAKLGELEKSIEYFQKGLDILKSIQARDEVALTMARIAEISNRKGEFAKALETASQSREMAAGVGAREALWRADLESGRARQGLGENARAERHYRDAIATIEELRRDVAGGEAEEESSFEAKLEPFHRMVGLLLAGGREAEAFEFGERAKARVLTDVLRNGKAELATQLTADERARDRTLRVRLASLNTQAMRGPTESRTAELSRARAEYDNFQNELYIRHPKWKATNNAVDPVTVEQALALIAKPKTAFVEYVVTEDKVYGFASQGARKLKTFSVPVTREALTKQVEQLQRQLAGRKLDFRATASALYRTLIVPAGLDLADIRGLVIVPDGVLWDLPFQVLETAQGRYLLDECAVSYAPSLTALKTMIEVKRQRRGAPAGTQLLAMGDPAVGGLEGTVKMLYRDETAGDLPAAKREVENLRPIYGGSSHVYVGADARESRFKAEAGDARVLHLATHAVLNNASPLYSYLLLASEQGGGEDGLLEARELLTMNLRAELVVLSACETARGHVGAGEGIIGLSWALLVSGVPSTVLSQWKVASDSTSAFMTAFHQNRKKGVSDAESLRAAALSLRKNSAWQHPFYWAPFTLIGAGLN